jgi:hypothetical protein
LRADRIGDQYPAGRGLRRVAEIAATEPNEVAALPAAAFPLAYPPHARCRRKRRLCVIVLNP